MEKREFLNLLGSAPAAVLAAFSPPPPGTRARQLPNFTMTTHEGKQVRFYDDLLRGKLVLINFMYARCDGLCPGQTANLVKVQRYLGDRVGRDVHMYSITLDPRADTPRALRSYAEANGCGPGWLYLTGKPAEIEVLRRKLGFIDLDPVRDKQKVSHLGLVLYGYEPIDRWALCPALNEPDIIAENVLSMIGERAPWLSKFPKSSGSNH